MRESLLKTHAIIVTSEGGEPQTSQTNVAFDQANTTNTNRIEVFPQKQKQTMTGVGSSFTQASAFVLAHLSQPLRNQVMRNIYSEQGANLSLARTHIGACDFCVTGKYSYAEQAQDQELQHFSIDIDSKGFCQKQHPLVKDPQFALLPMIKQANEIKALQGDKPIQIVASAWTAPPWMKDINDWYQAPDFEQGRPGTGGHLKPEYESTYANYLVNYVKAYAEQGVTIWAITPVNEPAGNNGQWESMHFTAASQSDFIKQHLGPKLVEADLDELKVLIYDHNRSDLKHWVKTMLADPDTAQYIYGTAIHWYESTIHVSEDALQWVHDNYPEFDIIHTEGCIDDLGRPAPMGVHDAEGFQESGWYQNDSFWWQCNATDWAYTAEWAPRAEDHPMYTPVHRYARNIIVSFNHWVSGWIDWNIVLDAQGGPNHVGNFCGAPIMIDIEAQDIYYTPIFYILSQFSQSIRPGDVALQTRVTTVDLGAEDLYACATINPNNLLSVQVLNTAEKPKSFELKIGQNTALIEITANALQTIQLQLN